MVFLSMVRNSDCCLSYSCVIQSLFYVPLTLSFINCPLDVFRELISITVLHRASHPAGSFRFRSSITHRLEYQACRVRIGFDLDLHVGKISRLMFSHGLNFLDRGPGRPRTEMEHINGN